MTASLALAQVPASIIWKLHTDVVKLMNSDAMRKDIQGRGMVLKTDNSPEEFAA